MPTPISNRANVPTMVQTPSPSVEQPKATSPLTLKSGKSLYAVKKTVTNCARRISAFFLQLSQCMKANKQVKTTSSRETSSKNRILNAFTKPSAQELRILAEKTATNSPKMLEIFNPNSRLSKKDAAIKRTIIDKMNAIYSPENYQLFIEASKFLTFSKDTQQLEFMNTSAPAFSDFIDSLKGESNSEYSFSFEQTGDKYNLSSALTNKIRDNHSNVNGILNEAALRTAVVASLSQIGSLISGNM